MLFCVSKGKCTRVLAPVFVSSITIARILLADFRSYRSTIGKMICAAFTRSLRNFSGSFGDECRTLSIASLSHACARAGSIFHQASASRASSTGCMPGTVHTSSRDAFVNPSARSRQSVSNFLCSSASVVAFLEESGALGETARDFDTWAKLDAVQSRTKARAIRARMELPRGTTDGIV